jgi:hypothetical protein
MRGKCAFRDYVDHRVKSNVNIIEELEFEAF